MLGVPDFHPEFGLLCPSPRRRRGLRLAVLCIATMVAVGATMGLAVARWPASGDGATSTAEPINEQPEARVTAAGVEAAAPGRRSCLSDKVDSFKDLLGVFLDPVCGSNKPHARHGVRAPNRVATVTIGRKDAPAPSASALAATEPAEVKVENTEKSETVAAVERTKSPKKPKLKASSPIALTAPARELSRQNANPYATPGFGRETYDPYRNPYRATALQPGYAPFGRSW